MSGQKNKALKKYQCSICSEKFTSSLMRLLEDENGNKSLCSLCDLRHSTLDQIQSVKDDFQKFKEESADEIAALKLEIAFIKDSKTDDNATLKTPLPSQKLNKSYAEVTSPQTNAPSQVNQYDEFKPVKNGSYPRSLPSSLPIKLKNSFELLDNENILDDNIDSESITLVGDSMLRDQHKHYCRHDENLRKFFSYGGSSLSGPKRLIDHAATFTQGATANTTFLIHVGTNDLLNNKRNRDFNPDDLINKYRALLKDIRTRSGSNKICILGLLPVFSDSLRDVENRKYFNELLHKLANDEGVIFLSLWRFFADDSKLFNSGQIHLAKAGSIQLSRLLHEYVIPQGNCFTQPQNPAD